VPCAFSKAPLTQPTAIDGKFNFDRLSSVITGAFHSQGYKDALFPVTIETGQPLLKYDNASEEDEVLDQQRSLTGFRKWLTG
jgi:hypothetical protein